MLADYDVPVEPAPDFEFPQAGGDETFRVPDYEAPPPPPDFEAPSRSQPDYEAPQRTYNEPQAPPAPAPRRHQDESLGNRLSPFIGVLIFLLIIASQVCRALTESG